MRTRRDCQRAMTPAKIYRTKGRPGDIYILTSPYGASLQVIPTWGGGEPYRLSSLVARVVRR